MKRISLSLLLALWILSPLISDAQQAGSIPQWFLDNMASQIGTWTADNSKYKSEAEPVEEYVLEWKWGVGHKSMTGHLFSRNEGRTASPYWEIKQYWNPADSQGVLLQFGADGIFGIGQLKMVAEDSVHTIQTFHIPGGASFRMGHRTKHSEYKQKAISYDIGRDDEWKEGRRYTWQKSPARGKLERVKVEGEGLKGNRTGDSPVRDVLVYTPPSYQYDPTGRFPVLYLLHGYGESAEAWVESPHTQGFHVQRSLDSLIRDGRIRDMIVVMPDCSNRWGGSWYTNSDAGGRWEDFVSDELVSYIDTNFRTLARASSRGIAGHSMGGYGALRIAFRHPDVFGLVYGMSSVNLAADRLAQLKFPELQARIGAMMPPDSLSLIDRLLLSKAVAFVPDDSPPYYCKSPFENIDGEWQLNKDIWKEWLAHLVTNQIESLEQSDSDLRIAFDHGSGDFLVSESRQLSKALDKADIPHEYFEYEGGHTDKVRERLEGHVFPFFSTHMSR